MDFGLKWWQWAVMGMLVLITGGGAVMGGGSFAAIYGRVSGAVLVSVGLVYGGVIVGRAVTASDTESPAAN